MAARQLQTKLSHPAGRGPHQHPRTHTETPFKAATGTTLIEYLQNLRTEEVKRLLEAGQMPVDDISIEVSYEDSSFFRRLFKRLTGLTPSQYRRMFQRVINASGK